MIRLTLVLLVLMLSGCGRPPATSKNDTVLAKSQQQPNNTDASVAAMTPQAAKSSGIEILAAGPASIRETLTLYGAVRSNAEREQNIRARYPGVVRTVSKRPGDRITRGETLLTVESNDSLEPYSIASPMNGSILERSVNPGESVDASMALFRVADLSTVWAEFAVFPRDLARVRPGLPIRIHMGDSGLSATTILSYVAPTGHAESQSVLARAQFVNTGNRWIAGQFVTGEVVASETKAKVTVAPSAIQTLKGAPAVFVQSFNGFEPRLVKIGRRDRESIEILEGVQAGEMYAGKNSYLIKADLLKVEADED